MKVLFSNPPWWQELVRYATPEGGELEMWNGGVRAGSRWPFTAPVRSFPDQPVFGDYLPYPFFMGYAASYAKKHTSADIHFRDSLSLRDSYDRFFQYLLAERFDRIVIESASPSWEHDKLVINQIVQHMPYTKVVVTGPITALGNKIFDESPVIAAIQGEYEKGIVKVINGAEGLIGHDLLTREEMNDAPFPWYDPLHAHLYCDPCPNTPTFPHAHVWSSRGCPFKCIFCVWPATMTGNDPDGQNKRSVRHYSPEYMEAFLTEIAGKYGYRSIYFDDDTFNLGNSHVIKMCEVMRKIDLPWAAMCRADTMRLETWKIMKESGCYGVKLGFESGNQFVVDQIVNKHLDLEFAKSVVHEIKAQGMSVHGTFTYGLPGETKAQMQDTKNFIASLPFDTIQESGTAEIEGTPLATLRAGDGAVLPGYEGARIDDGYVVAQDGGRKWRQLAAELRDG